MAKSLADIRSAYRWNGTRYQSTATGRFVSEAAVKQDLLRFVRRTQKEIAALAREATAGTLDVAEWQSATAYRIKNAHLAARAAARGGWANLTPADFGRVGVTLKQDYERLAKFARDVESGRMTPRAVEARAEMYASHVNSTFERGRFDSYDDLAKTGVVVEMRNVLGIGEHCTASDGRPGCKEESARGWVEMGTLSLPGSRRCLSRCKCRVAYRER